MTKYVYFFGGGSAEGGKDMKDLLGSKGAGLAEMTNAGLPVPPGFIISTEVCRVWSRTGFVPDEAKVQMDEALARLELLVDQQLGSTSKPLLVSVRSGAKASMPGMMDTVLNLGLNDETVRSLKRLTSNGRFAEDSYRRFVSMFGEIVLGVAKYHFDSILEDVKRARGAKNDAALDESALHEVVEAFKRKVREATGREFPADAREQLVLARDAVFRSWNNPRAVEYRKLYHIPHDLGTAVSVQKMVFGNLGPRSATGVGFTRNPSTGAKEFFGEFLLNAQGEDVVAGIRTPQPIAKLREVLPEAYDELTVITDRLERHYQDVQDFEFTIEEGKLYMLQTRAGKRTGPAAVRIAVDMVDEGLVTPKEALLRVEPQALDQLLHPIFDPVARTKFKAAAKGIPASPGAATGQVVFDADDAVSWSRSGKRVVLVRMETSPDDVHGMSVAQGILTATGGRTSHAAVVGRQMGKPAVVGCDAIKVDEVKHQFTIGESVVRAGDVISIDGATGEVMLAEVPTVPSEVLQVIAGTRAAATSETYQRFARLLEWADQYRRLDVRANADVPKDAEIAVAFGAKGIGLCRTEHMFFAEERLPLVEKMILASTSEERERYLDQLAPLQRADFLGLFHVMKGHPVTIRLLDPPLHEFLPRRETLLVELTLLRRDPKRSRARIAELEAILARVDQLHEFNPMLGHRGCRLGITYPEITRMQAHAIFHAASQVVKEGGHVVPEVMVPLVGDVREFEAQKAIIDQCARESMEAEGVSFEYRVGTMIELPRGALTADAIARSAEFFSFGTNDLTQMTFGFSRDDAGKFLPTYFEAGILERDPFESIDVIGVGELVRIGVAKGRHTRPGLKIGICGEHGGDPDSIRFFHQAGLDYVSASPYRVPVARLAAARAALEELDEVGP